MLHTGRLAEVSTALAAAAAAAAAQLPPPPLAARDSGSVG